MRNWNNFYGCESLSDIECIEFLSHLEDSGIINTNDGSFLHNQYMRELMNIRGIEIGTLEPSNGASGFYNINNITSQYNEIKNNPTSLLMAWYMRVNSYEYWIKVIKEPYIPLRINVMKSNMDSIYANLKNQRYIKDIINILIKNRYDILLVGDKELLDKKYIDMVFKKSNKEYDINLCNILSYWCNGNATEKHICGSNVFIYNANIFNLSFKYEWKGYCPSCGLVQGVSKTYGKYWINMNDKPRSNFLIRCIQENYKI